MAPQHGKYTKYWTDAKKEFTRATKVSKPGETFLFWKKGTGVEASLKKVDAVIAKSWQTQKGFDTYRQTLANFTTYYLAYRQTLSDAVEAAKKGNGIPKKLTASAYEQALKALDSSLVQIETAGSGRLATSLSAVNITKNVPATVGRAKTFIANVRHNPVPATFNGGIGKAARDVTQQIGNFDKLKDLGMDVGIATPKNLFTVLSAWADKGRKVKDTANQAAVLKETVVFEQAIEGVEKWWATVSK